MTFKPHHDPTHLYFVTATLTKWQPLFTQPTYADIILNSLDWHRRNRRWLLFAYVVMPTHLHILIKPLAAYTISNVLESFGSFTAHAILRQLQAEHRDDLLQTFSQRQDGDRGKAHQVWQPLQAKNVFSEPFLREKLEYIHNNPVAKQWALAETRADYRYSSACFYDCGIMPGIEVDNVWAEPE